MDHLPLPRHPCRVVEVSYFCGHEFGNLAFFQYPEKASVNIDAISRGIFKPYSAEAIAAFVQTWLFFGLLNQILNPKITHHDFVTEGRTVKQRINTSRLEPYVAQWKAHFAQLGNAEQFAEQDRVWGILREARRVMNQIGSTRSVFGTPDFLGAELELSIWICIQTLEFKLFPNLLPRQRVIDDHGTRICTSLLDMLASYGYCANQIDMLARCMDVSSLYYISLLGPASISKNHAGCTIQQCLVDQIDEAHYQTMHAREDCKCHFVGPDMEKVHAILEKGDIPVISPIFDAKDIEHPLDVLKATPTLRYVALSHVWSDGLGNARDNTVPACQLEFICEAVKQVGPVDGIWFDTLCVPLRPEESRKAAIRLMRRTYTEAYAVLVLDHGVMQIESSVPYEELFMWITCSGWLRRLWTFQEGLMAKKLRFLLKDKVVNILEVFDLMTNESTSEYPSTVALEASAFFRYMRSNWDWTNPDKRMTFGSLWEALQWRSTSKRSDEPICLAPLFGLDVDMILDLPEEDRLRKVYSLQKSFPPYLIFSRGARMSEVGYRWAPPSLMIPRALETSKMHHMADEGRWHPKGLIVAFPGFIFDMPQGESHDFEQMIHFKESATGRWYLMYGEFDDSLRDEGRWDEMYFRGLVSAAIIVSCPLAQLADMNEWDALLVTIREEEDGVLFCHYVANASVSGLREHLWSAAEEERVDWSKEKHQTLIRAVSVRSLPNEQRWCVG